MVNRLRLSDTSTGNVHTKGHKLSTPHIHGWKQVRFVRHVHHAFYLFELVLRVVWRKSLFRFLLILGRRCS
jgi:hypothetical protein